MERCNFSSHQVEPAMAPWAWGGLLKALSSRKPCNSKYSSRKWRMSNVLTIPDNFHLSLCHVDHIATVTSALQTLLTFMLCLPPASLQPWLTLLHFSVSWCWGFSTLGHCPPHLSHLLPPTCVIFSVSTSPSSSSFSPPPSSCIYFLILQAGLFTNQCVFCVTYFPHHLASEIPVAWLVCKCQGKG